MLRTIFPVILALALLLSACGQTQAPATAQVSLMVWGDPAEKAAYESLVKAFEQKHPIDVKLLHIPSQADYRTRLAGDFAAGTPPDLMLLNYRRISAFASKGALEPLGTYLGQSQVIDQTEF